MGAPLACSPHLINIRRNEIEVLSSLYGAEKIRQGAKILEIGCGNTFASAFFPKAGLVVCTDLPTASVIHNKPSLHMVKRACDSLGLRPVKFVGCCAWELPFKDEMFDIVFSQYVLEHIKDRDKTIEEFKRVLKKGGLIISLVPNFVEKFYEFPRYYLYLFKSLFIRLRQRLNKHPLAIQDNQNRRLQKNRVNFRNFLKYYPHFPFIEPHGEYKNAVEEFTRHLPLNWMKLFKRHNMEIADIFSTNFLPWNFLDVISYQLTDFLYQKSKQFTVKIGKMEFIRYLGYSLCIIASKKA